MKTLKSALVLTVVFLMAGFAYSQRSDGTTSEYIDVDNVQTVEGEITDVNHPIAKMKGDDGKEYEVHMGPFWYWDENQYKLQHNVRARIKGEVKEVQGRYEFYPWEIVQDGKTMTFADDKGVPSWSKGKGKGKGNGKGKGYGKGRGNCPYRNK
jgi:hypothetical protein